MDDLLTLVRVLHVAGNVFWLGGGAFAAFATAWLVGEKVETRRAALPIVRGLVLKIVSPALLVAFVAGLTLLVLGWTQLYAHAPWAHTKLTFGLIGAGAHGVLVGRL